MSSTISTLCVAGCGGGETGQGGADASSTGSRGTVSGSVTGGDPSSSASNGSGTTDVTSVSGTTVTSTSSDASSTTTSDVASSSTGVVACGAPGEACCAGNTCDAEATCDGGTCALTCVACGTTCEAGACIAAADVTAGSRFSCALLSTGSIRCWGHNESFELGDGTDEGRWQPMPLVPEIPGVVAIASAPTDAHSCARTASGGVWCWGSNYLGQLGGDDDPPGHPIEVTSLAGPAAEVEVGGEGTQGYTCVRLVDGTVWCWGKPGGMVPIQRASITDATAIAVGGWHACAIVGGGQVTCWGQNVRGQLGTGNFDAVVGEGMVTGITNAKALALGRVHSCALLTDDTVKCWGDNDDGKLGIGPTTGDVATPTAVVGLSGVAKITAGQNHSCAVLTDGTAHCWGDNILGQLGIGTFDGEADTPQTVMSLAGATSIAAGSFHTCAGAGDGRVYCWGYNQADQLGAPGNSWSVPHLVEWAP